MGTKMVEIDEAREIAKSEQKEVDETFEIISKKEKYWREQLLEAESNLFKSEGNVRINQMLIKIASEEVEKEADKNAR